MDSDSEINWDEDEDLGDTEIPGTLIFGHKLSKMKYQPCTNISKSNLNVSLLVIVLLYKDDESESLSYLLLKIAL